MDLQDQDGLITVTWSEPEETNGIVRYVVTLIGVNRINGSIFLSESLEVSNLEVNVTRRIFSEYRVTVTPQTGAGMGPVSMETLTTPEEGKHNLILILTVSVAT